MSFQQRTRNCGEIRAEDSGTTIVLNGWIHRIRDLGGLLFIDLRDRTGIVQLFLNPESVAERTDLRPEACLSVQGKVVMRSEPTRNSKMATGDIEVTVVTVQVLGESKPLPFPVSDEEQMLSVNEELRIKHRYLDLRRPSMNKRFSMRSSLITRMRNFLDTKGFVEVETPIITKSTPEGARDYLVAYRLEPGKWYALPQSPQQYKQLLMVGGMERYYQVAKCFRDESQRADRQPEFTQLDIEMSFCTQEDILNLAESLMIDVVNHVIEKYDLPKEKVQPFERLTYADAMKNFGSDKPDLRFGLPFFDASETLKNSDFGVFKNTLETGGVVKGVRYPNGGNLSRKEFGQLEEVAKEFGAKGLASVGVESVDGKLGLKGSLAKFFSAEEAEGLLAISSAEENDLLCFVADDLSLVHTVLGKVRLEIGDRCQLRDPRVMKFCWIIDFPLVEWDGAAGRWDPTHHMFTMPKHEDFALLETDPGKVRADCYDMVCNGLELASGSIRIHRPDIQAKIFDLLGIDEATQQSRFGHILEAFSYGAPPHGGIAPGIDRLIMILCDTENIREVIAFPKVGGGYDPLMDSPSSIDPMQWAELGLRATL